MMRRFAPRGRGVALIEALVALLVMSFGMVAVAGLMGTMRRSADLAKQRGEALRIAQQEMETLRDFSLLTAPATPAYGDQRDFEALLPIDTKTRTVNVDNTSYTMTWTVLPWDANEATRRVRISVAWTDRAGDTPSVITDSFIMRSDPSLGASLGIAPTYSATQRMPDGRSQIPPTAKDLGDGRSVLKPGTRSATVAFIFDNLTGVVTGRCTVDANSTTTSLLAGDLTSNCTTVANGFVLWGYVRFASASPLSAANLASSMATTFALPLDMQLVASPGMSATPSYECFDDGPADVTPPDPLTGTQHTTNYFCVVIPVAVRETTTTDSSGTTTSYDWAGGTFRWSASSPTTPVKTSARSLNAWFGRLEVGGIIPATGTPVWQVCRFSGNYDGSDPTAWNAIGNAEHPLDYRLVTGALGNQNFVVIKATETCPSGIDGTTGSTFFQTATVAHQPGGATTPTSIH